mmetsp:Transcript_24756/g.41867  ORF Transcript_24756/g.41867 Transcript_24756/m.41867 type:complete len:209 (-) Transcript_24756:692-1318(-)
MSASYSPNSWLTMDDRMLPSSLSLSMGRDAGSSTSITLMSRTAASKASTAWPGARQKGQFKDISSPDELRNLTGSTPPANRFGSEEGTQYAVRGLVASGNSGLEAGGSRSSALPHQRMSASAIVRHTRHCWKTRPPSRSISTSTRVPCRGMTLATATIRGASGCGWRESGGSRPEPAPPRLVTCVSGPPTACSSTVDIGGTALELEYW